MKFGGQLDPQMTKLGCVYTCIYVCNDNDGNGERRGRPLDAPFGVTTTTATTTKEEGHWSSGVLAGASPGAVSIQI